MISFDKNNIYKLDEIGWRCILFVSSKNDIDPSGIEQKIITMDGAKIKNESDLYEVMSEALNFPDYYGKNYNATIDCLRDMNIWMESETGWILIVENAKQLAQADFMTMGDLIRIWTFCAQEWAEEKKIFYLVFVAE